jgi:two-component system, NarL family, sensor histidine kinase UhpB
MTAIYTTLRPNRISIRWRVSAIVALTLVPILFMVGWLVVWLARSERSQLEACARSQLREVVAAIEREIVHHQNVLTVLAASPFLQVSGNLEKFHYHASEISQKLGMHFVVRDHLARRQVINTAVPWNTELSGGIPAPRNHSEIERLRKGQPLVFYAPLVHIVIIIVPVLHAGELRHSVATAVPLARFAEILNSPDVSPDHLITITDRDGHIVTRSDRHAEFPGTRVMVPLPPENNGRSVDTEAIPIHWCGLQSELTGWYFSVQVPDHIFEAPATRARTTITLAGSLFLALGVAFSYFLGSQLAQSAGALGIDRTPTREEFEILFEAAPHGVIVVGSNGFIMLVNKHVQTRFGYTESELIGQRIELLIPERFRAAHVNHRALFARKPEISSMSAGGEILGRRKDGSEFPVEIMLNPISTGTEKLLMATVVDISKERLAQRNLTAALEQRDELRRRYIQTQESERLRLAQELHDQTGQTLTAVTWEMKKIESLLNGSERDRMRSLRTQMDEVREILHRVARELRPLSIDEVGLTSAVSNYLSEWSSRYGIETDFYCSYSRIDDLPNEARTTIYRIMQEALTNVAKHARNATETSVVVIQARNQGLRLVIDDNGCGFDANALNRDSGHLGLGLTGMRERIAALGGEIAIESVVGVGTTIFANIPLDHWGRPT